MHNNNFENEKDNPYIINLKAATILNNSLYQNIWTAGNMQVILVSLNPNENFPLTMHPDMDELFYIIQGQGRIFMGNTKDEIKYDSYIVADSVVFLPAGMWHKLVNQYVYPLKFIEISAFCNNQTAMQY